MTLTDWTADIWPAALRAALLLYTFAPLDAYFTAREANRGLDPDLIDNPRVAVGAILAGYLLPVPCPSP